MNSERDLISFLQKIAQQTIPLLHLEYPTLLIHSLPHAQPLQTHRELHPLFFGCYDWHSAVHSHWQLLRIWRVLGETAVTSKIHTSLSASFDNLDGIAIEAHYLQEHVGFERPYGLAWLLYLCRELRLMSGKPFDQWQRNLEPLETVAIENMVSWLPKLPLPIRGGLHNQTAFSLCLIWDWAQVTQRNDVLNLVQTCAERWYANDQNAPIAYEPSTSDFLSPTLATVDLMRRVWEERPFLTWLDRYLPDLNSPEAQKWLQPVVVVDEKDGRLAHFAGLNLSRAWMLSTLANQLQANDNRAVPLQQSAKAHLDAGLSYTISDEYMLSHWVPSFAVYSLSSVKTKRQV